MCPLHPAGHAPPISLSVTDLRRSLSDLGRRDRAVLVNRVLLPSGSIAQAPPSLAACKQDTSSTVPSLEQLPRLGDHIWKLSLRLALALFHAVALIFVAVSQAFSARVSIIAVARPSDVDAYMKVTPYTQATRSLQQDIAWRKTQRTASTKMSPMMKQLS